ncbi:CehA/McbA family metallohydrolase [candidate division KSB1 bacterium]|nr:CehA/McbA family metallohydrolase [candidate division KSB1 bacterium]
MPRSSHCVLIVALFALFACDSAPEFEVPDATGMRWFKGNTHTHTTMSDGDSPPEVVARWYKDHGYRFLVLSDHNVFLDPLTLSTLQDSAFLLIPGEEVSAKFREKPVHVNGLNVPGVIAPQSDSSLVGTIQKNVDAIRSVNAVPHINHPNFRWAFNHRELLQIRNDKLLEIFNGHPQVHNLGGGGWPGMEQVWDHLLSAGKRVYGIAVDDAHHFQGEFATERSNPGRGWVVVKAQNLAPREIVENLEAGFFYASTGVVLHEIQIESQKITIHIQPQGDFKYRTEFIGAHGRILLATEDNPAVFELHNRESYVRAKVSDSSGRAAWVQPVFTR